MLKMKKMLPLLFCVSALIAGCGATDDKEDTTAAKKNAEGVYEPVLTIKTGKQLDENAGKYDSGDDLNNNPFIDLGVEKLGIKIETTLLGGDASNYDTKLRLALTGSEELPDLFPVYSKQMISDMIDSGQVKAIDEDIDQYMSDRLKKIYNEFPELAYPVTRDGKTYGLASVPSYGEGQVLIVRQDWLDNLGLEAPTNLEEFGEVIKAFTEDDPDGNGKDDTFGFTYSGNDIYNNGWISDSVTIFSANTGKNVVGSWQENESGELTYGSINEGNKKSLALMQDWHANGYLFQEAAATGAWDAMDPFIQGKAGIMIGSPWVADSVKDVTSVDPNAKIATYANLLQDNGEPAYQTVSTNDGFFMFNKDFDQMEAFFDYLDWLYDYAYGTGDFKYGYLQEYDYDIIDDQPVFDTTQFDPPKDAAMDPSKLSILKNAPKLTYASIYGYNAYNGNEPTSALDFKMNALLETSPEYIKASAMSYEDRDYRITDGYTGPTTETMNKSWEQLATLEKQTYTNIIYGKQSVDSFDDFVKQWNEQGGEQITKEVNEWYQSVK